MLKGNIAMSAVKRESPLIKFWNGVFADSEGNIFSLLLPLNRLTRLDMQATSMSILVMLILQKAGVLFKRLI